jgi:RNA polymerase sigma-70 factor (ECF subfamily)
MIATSLPGNVPNRRQQARNVGETRSPGSVSAVPLESETSFDLLVRARSGDNDALNDLCARYLPRLHRWAQGRVPPGARGDADTGDVVQEVLVHVVRHIPVFEPRDAWSFQAYLRRALLNRLRDLARRESRRPAADPLEPDQAASDPSPLELAVGAEGLRHYEAALLRLRPQDQLAVVARCEWGAEYSDIAGLLGKPSANAARVAIHRAILRLAEEIARERARP